MRFAPSTNLPSTIAWIAAIGIAAGCSATRASSSSIEGAGGEGASSSATGGGGTSDTSSGSGLDFDGGTTGDASSPSGPAEVFAESSSTLYKLNPDTKSVTVVGDFSGCSSVIDIAVDKDGKMFGTTFDGLYAIDRTTAKCTPIASGSYPNSLSLVPKGTVDPNDEALVGYVDSTYVRIDKVTGEITNIGSLGNNGYISSGDIVSVIGGGTYLTVKGNNCGDCLVQVNPATGSITKMLGPLGHGSVFGLAYWGGVAFGFDDTGELFAIDLASLQTTNISTPGAPNDLSFWGAGSTTAAPVTPK